MSGLNSVNLDFLPVQNIEEMDTVIGGVGALPIGKTRVKRALVFAEQALTSTIQKNETMNNFGGRLRMARNLTRRQ